MITKDLFTEELIRQFDVPGPRYTSYPTADRFVDTFASEDQADVLRRRSSRAGGARSPLSLYVHIPFCESLCYYCACNKVVTRHREQANTYLNYISKELDLLGRELRGCPTVSQVHLGGGTPTFLTDSELARLMRMLDSHFSLVAGVERAVEIDPRTIDVARLDALAAMGFNRLSFGVQDFDPSVQQAVHRIQPRQKVIELVDAARTKGFESLNVDLIYGLPRQTTDSIEKTMSEVIGMRPDRVALYAYAHLPQRFKPQRRISNEELPSASGKVKMLALAMRAFLDAGYVYIGMDHFALPTDALAVAKRQGRLHRNFQGYSTQPDCDLIGLGVSAIGRVGSSYSQNAKELDQYYRMLDQQLLPVVRGMRLSRDDLIRRSVIMALMCQGDIYFDTIEETYLIDFASYFEKELLELTSLEDCGLVRIHRRSLEVTEQGWFFVRAVAMVFDRYLASSRSREQFSKIL